MPTVNIREDLYGRLEEYVKRVGAFNSVEEFVNFVLEELISEEKETALSPEEEEKVKERLRALGYI